MKIAMVTRFGYVMALLGALAIAPLGIAQDADAGGEVEFSADETILFEDGYNVELKGNVYLKNEDLELRADHVFINFEQPEVEGGESTFIGATAEGNVWSKSKVNIVEITSDHMDYTEVDRVAVYTGNVQIDRDGSKASSDEARLNLDTGIYELIGRVKGSLRGAF